MKYLPASEKVKTTNKSPENRVVRNTVKRLIKSPTGTILLKALGSGAGEAVQGLLEPFIKQIYQEDIPMAENSSNIDPADILYAGLIGFTVGLLYGGAETAQSCTDGRRRMPQYSAGRGEGPWGAGGERPIRGEMSFSAGAAQLSAGRQTHQRHTLPSVSSLARQRQRPSSCLSHPATAWGCMGSRTIMDRYRQHRMIHLCPSG